MKITTKKLMAAFLLLAFTLGGISASAQFFNSNDERNQWMNQQTNQETNQQNNQQNNSSPNGQLNGAVTGSQNSGNLKIDSIETTDGSATADGTFQNGLKYTFNITVPTNESNLSMKFSDWVRFGGNGTIPAANNIRISSPQANNTGTVLITAANTYSSPTFNMTGDLNPSMAGRQVKVIVEVSVPTGTPNGNYGTNYGVRTVI